MQRHPFHLVDYSPWPILVSGSVFLLPLSLLYAMRRGNTNVMIFALAQISLIAGLWWRDVVREATFQGCHTSRVVTGLRMAIILFITREVIFFFRFFWAFFASSLAPGIEIGAQWPPTGIVTVPAIGVPLLNTSVLLLSGVSVTWAHHAAQAGNFMQFNLGLLYTWLLGVYFLILQLGEYNETIFSAADSVYGSVFFLTTGFHGLHVLVGTIFLIVNWARVLAIHFSPTRHEGFVFAAWYWHFVDVVWLFLYLRVYWWGAFTCSLNKARIL